MTPPPHSSSSARPGSTPGARAALGRDLTWGRPVFLPPALPEPRILLEAFPSLVRRVTHWPSRATRS